MSKLQDVTTLASTATTLRRGKLFNSPMAGWLHPATFVCFIFVAVATAACTELEAPTCPEGTDQFVEYQLFMGRGGPGGEVVDDAAWDAFLEDTVTPRFPDGLTVLDGAGQWRGSEGVIEKERSKLLIILAPPGDGGMRLINEISEEYERRFNQESVLRTVNGSCVSFS